METLYEVLKEPSQEILLFHSIDYFDDVIKKYPSHYKQIIKYINECFNYRSPLLVKEKDWGLFLMERFMANGLPEDLHTPLLEYDSEEIVYALASFLSHQKQDIWTTLVAKQDLRRNMLATMQSFGASAGEKKVANELVSNLDIEINEIYERLRQDQERVGNYKGVVAIKSAKQRFKLNIANWID